MAVATHPLGPFARHGDKPVLDLGPPGSWDDQNVACAMILKEAANKFYMWYSGYGHKDPHRKWSIGLAVASNPLGPWKKHENNPILEDFGYVGGVVKVKGIYLLYTEHPIGSTGPDYGPMSLATADAPTGPWNIHPQNPVLRQGEWGEWDDGGFSEAEVLYAGGVFHMFYGGAKLYRPRILTRESIGYAYSFDGRRFTKYGRNPVAAREAQPNAAAFAEVHAIFEPPFVYLYHTLRYKKPWRPEQMDRFPSVEDIGVQVLAVQRPFSLSMPVLSRKTLAAKTTTPLIDSPPICLSNVTRVSLTAACRYRPEAAKGIRLHLRSSPDGLDYDTADFCTLDNAFTPGRLCRKTFPLDAKVRFLKVTVENLDESESVSDIEVTATLGS